MTTTTIGPLPSVIRKIPQHCMRPSLGKSLAYLGRDVALVIFFFWAIVVVDSWWLGLPLALLLGGSIGGMFVLGHDCGHRSFTRGDKWNNFFGHICTSAVLWPFHVWRLDHDAHHRHTSHIDRDPAWRPITFRMWKRMPRIPKTIYIWTRSRVFFLGSIYTTYSLFKDAFKAPQSKRLSDRQKREIKFSVWLTIGVSVAYVAASFAVAGIYGFIYLWLVPQLVFHALLSTFTFFHHTAPDSSFLDRKTWKPELAQLTKSLHVRYPWLIETLCHDINWHVPHHVCVGVPHYHLRHAHAALKEAYPEYVRESVFNLKLIRETTGQCHFIRSKSPADLSWVTLEEMRDAPVVTTEQPSF